ncbi:hypothetical protein HHI36_016681 [Cryptolaemus montrouzieri]|uniref:FP protein C-terminal domain-containing protein n=1 Tax=Cryptolaemus montrouzieri TaxID=559131 RepID=A0ABD2NL84_9CUCU
MGKKVVSVVKQCGNCDKKFTKSEYSILCSGPCTKWHCEGGSGLEKDQLKIIMETESLWQCKSYAKKNRKSIILAEENTEEEDEEGEEEITVAQVMKQMAKNHESLTRTMDKFREKEDTKDLVTKIMSRRGIPVKTEEFESRRISKKENSPIVIKFKSKSAKTNILMKRKEIGTLEMKDCGFFGVKVIYFNEDLSHTKHELYSRVRKSKKDKNYDFAWIKNGNIYVKKNESSRPILIKHETDLEALYLPEY